MARESAQTLTKGQKTTSGCSVGQIQLKSSNRQHPPSQTPGDRQWSSLAGQTQPHPHKHISYLFHVDFKGAKGLTLWTGSGFHLLVLGLEEGSQDEAALAAVVFDHAELRQDPRATCHYPAGPDQLIQVQLPVEKQRDAGCLRDTGGRIPYRNTLATRHNS